MDIISSGLNGPSAKVPSTSNETTFPTPSLQLRHLELAAELRVIIAEKSERYRGMRDYDEIVNDPDILNSALFHLSSMTVDEAEVFVSNVRLKHLFEG